MLDHWLDRDLIRALQNRGYVVRHASEVRKPLSWNRTGPLPEHVDFKAEAIAMLRNQITPEVVDFVVEPGAAPEFEGDLGRPEIHRAILRVL